MVVAGGIAGVAIALAAVYGINTIQRNAGDTACAGAAALAQRLAPLAHGEVAAFAVADPPVRLPDLVFRDADGAERRLADWRGRTVLLNLWATWCGPCRYEIPELETLHKRYASRGFEVIGVSVDEVGAEAVKSFVEEQKMTYPVVLDPEGKLANVLQTSMLPTSVLVDRNGKIVWKKVGAIEPQDLELESAIVKAL